jgi:UDP-galactopyranose mutase
MHDLIVFSHLRWDVVFERPQHLLSRLAHSRRIYFVEAPVRTEHEAFFEVTSPCEGVQVLRPHTPADETGFHDDQFTAVRSLLASWMRKARIEDYAVWFYTPAALPLLSQLNPVAVVCRSMPLQGTAFRAFRARSQSSPRSLLPH